MQKKTKTILIIIVSILALTTIFYFGKKQEKKQELPIITRKECNLFVQTKNVLSEHVIIREVFWNNKLETCLIVASRPFPEASDWAVNYIKEKNLESYTIIEAIRFSLVDLNKSYPEAEIFSQTYQYANLNEYLENPDKRKNWEADFLQQVQKYQ